MLILSVRALLLAGLLASTEGREPPKKEDPKDPATLLEVTSKIAGSPALLATNARAYADARRMLARGQAAAVLKALAKNSAGGLFEDREALLKADALLALGEKKKAKEQYLIALEKAQVESVSLAAARGLVSVLGLLDQKEEQLLYVDALLSKNIARKQNMLLQRAQILRSLGRNDEAAEAAWKLIRDFPAAKILPQANALLRELQKKGVKVPISTPRIELARIKNMIASGAYDKATVEIDKLEKANPSLKFALVLQRADILKRKRLKQEEFELLASIYKQGGLEPEDEADLIYRLGKNALSRDDNAGAQRFFDELELKHAEDARTPEAQYLAAWVPYNAGDYATASERMLRFATNYRKAPNRSEALWFAAWSAYLDKKDGLARRALEQLLEEHPNTDLGPQARYWIGRIKHRGGDEEGAKTSYREVLARVPLSYWGFWAMTRLEQLGEKTVLEPPPATKEAPMSKIVGLLGPERPINIDRAIALYNSDLKNDALDELTAANTYLRKIKDTAGRTMVADLLQALGAHHLAFLVGAGIAQDGGDLVSGKPHAWRAWRHAYPRAFDKEVKASAAAHEVQDQFILSIMRTESSFRTNARSPVGAFGLMQIMPGTATQIGRSTKDARAHAARFKNADSNVWLGGWYLARLLERYDGQLAPAIGAYNAGPGAMDKWISGFGGLELDEFVERVPYRETRRYIRRVLETYMVYRRLDGQPLLQLAGKVRGNSVPEGSVAF
jgi:soluble lytic murein transglycosylase